MIRDAALGHLHRLFELVSPPRTCLCRLLTGARIYHTVVFPGHLQDYYQKQRACPTLPHFAQPCALRCQPCRQTITPRKIQVVCPALCRVRFTARALTRKPEKGRTYVQNSNCSTSYRLSRCRSHALYRPSTSSGYRQPLNSSWASDV